MKYRIVYDTRNEELGFRIQQRDGLLDTWVDADVALYWHKKNYFTEFDEAEKMLKRIVVDGRPATKHTISEMRVLASIVNLSDELKRMTEEAEDLQP